MQTTLVTSNPRKLEEARLILGEGLQSHALDIPEIQSMDVAQVVRAKVRAAWSSLHVPVMVEDVAVSLACLDGFPGPFVKFFEERNGYENALLLAGVRRNFRMQVCSSVAYRWGDMAQQERVVTQVIEGTLVPRRGSVGWGFDFYFVPDGEAKTYAEMGPERKSQISHRAQALRTLRAIITRSDESLI